MDNALENNNLEEGQVNDNVGQDEGGTQQESSTDWEQQAKYHQSEKDKLYAENHNLKKYESSRLLGAPTSIARIQLFLKP